MSQRQPFTWSQCWVLGLSGYTRSALGSPWWWYSLNIRWYLQYEYQRPWHLLISLKPLLEETWANPMPFPSTLSVIIGCWVTLQALWAWQTLSHLWISRPESSKTALRSLLVASWGTLPMKILIGFLMITKGYGMHLPKWLKLFPSTMLRYLRVGKFHFESFPLVSNSIDLPHSLLGALSE